jgi:hypothetical protein
VSMPGVIADTTSLLSPTLLRREESRGKRQQVTP